MQILHRCNLQNSPKRFILILFSLIVSNLYPIIIITESEEHYLVPVVVIPRSNKKQKQDKTPMEKLQQPVHLECFIKMTVIHQISAIKFFIMIGVIPPPKSIAMKTVKSHTSSGKI